MLQALRSFFSKNDLERYGVKLDEEVGSGTYSTVYRGTWRKSTRNRIRVAIKVIDEKTASADFISNFLPREIEISKKLEHRNLLQTMLFFSWDDRTYIVTELGRFDLLQYLRLKGALRESLTRRLFHELCSGIQCMHDHQLVHRDIKCENLLITGEGTLKVADFGFARKFAPTEDDLSRTYCGSTAYTAPEILRARGEYNPILSDTWSCGIILFIMLTGSMPFNKGNLQGIIKTKSVKVVFPLPYSTRLTTEARNLVNDILQYNPQDRIRLGEVVAQSFDWYKKKHSIESENESQTHIVQSRTSRKTSTPGVSSSSSSQESSSSS